VKAIKLNDFNRYFAQVGLNLKEPFGNYKLYEFDEKNSDRLTIILTK
jgi:hypothetical protein